MGCILTGQCCDHFHIASNERSVSFGPSLRCILVLISVMLSGTVSISSPVQHSFRKTYVSVCSLQSGRPSRADSSSSPESVMSLWLMSNSLKWEEGLDFKAEAKEEKPFSVT